MDDCLLPAFGVYFVIKQIFPMLSRLFFLFFIAISFNVNGQLIYYIRPETIGSDIHFFGTFNIATCKDSTIFKINNTNTLQRILDIAVCPNGNFYVTGSDYSGQSHFAQLNLGDSSLSILNNIPTTSNSLTCDINNVLYGGSAFGLFTYNAETQITNSLGFLGFPLAGDLTFREDKLYGTTADNEFIEIDPNDLSATKVIYQYPLPNTFNALGVVTDVQSCDSMTTYITVTNQLFANITDTINRIYSIDPVAQTVSLVCETPWVIYGAATPNEFRASDCSVRLDLDGDDSAGLPGSDFQTTPFCGDSAIAAADTDAVFYSGYRVDSMQVRLLPPLPDAPAEYLSAPGGALVGVSGQNSPGLTLYNLAEAKDSDFLDALRSVRWHNNASPATAGLRTVEVIAFASGGRGDTAYTYIPVPPPVAAGRDTSLSFCPEAPAFDLTDALAAGAAAGGLWFPQTSSGASLFVPGADTPGVYRYVVGNGLCPADTALIAVSLSPQPVFNLGPDTTFCAGTTVWLIPSPPLPAAVFQWQDGSNQPALPAAQPGLYWAEAANAAGCRWRDSIFVVQADTFRVAEQAQPCAGQAYSWQGFSFVADTALCITYNTLTGCDSTRCLNLSFFYPSLTLDTAVCAGRPLDLFGKTWDGPGQYTDTLLLGGCLTALTLRVETLPADTAIVSAAICAGETYTVGSASFTSAGQYTIALPAVTGCDSIVALHLTVWPPVPPAQFTAFTCPGNVFNFNGRLLGAPGIYADTLPSAQGCDSVTILTLQHWPAPPAPAVYGDTLICAGRTAKLGASGTGSFTWSNGGGGAEITVSAPGIYSVTATDANGCTASGSITLYASPPLEADWAAENPACHDARDGYIELLNIAGGVPPFSYQLNGAAASGLPNFQGLEAGHWEVQVTDAAGCAVQYTFVLENPPTWTLTPDPASVLIQAGESVLLTVSAGVAGNLSYEWSPASGLSCGDCASTLAQPADTTVYRIVATDANGCRAETFITVMVSRDAPGLYFPTVFSPNGDGRNDHFTFSGDPAFFERTDLMRIYDRWGELVFEGVDLPLNDPGAGWDGAYRGKPLASGVYVYYVEIRQKNGDLVRRSGNVTLIR